MTESVYKVIELVGTSKNPGKRQPRQPSAGRENPCVTFASPKSSSSTFNSMRRARSKPTAPSSRSRSNSRAELRNVAMLLLMLQIGAGGDATLRRHKRWQSAALLLFFSSWSRPRRGRIAA